LSNFLKLVYNELFKIYVRKVTWVMYGFLFLIVLGGAFLVHTLDDELSTTYTDNWKEQLQEENDMYLGDISSSSDSEYFSLYYGELVERNNYHIENDIKPLNYGAWSYTLENAGLVSIISLFTIIIGAGIISNEYKWGTIKLLLIRPISRSKILLSKFLSVFIFAFVTMIFLLLSSLLAGAIFFGFEGLNPDIVVLKNDGFQHVPILGEVITDYSYKVVNLIMMTTLAFMISTIFKSSSLAVGVGIFLLMGGNIFVQAFQNYDWVKYILFANIDLKQYVTGNVLIEGMTLGFSVTVLFIYFVIFTMLTWLVFTKRDVAS